MFFGPLTRRKGYETKEDGTFYAYSDYRSVIAEDCLYKCVYCDSHEDSLGGRPAMELDHFRPWRKAFGPTKEKKFEGLKDEPRNLVHACGICNGFKWSHWPTEDPDKPYDHEKGWIEPFNECRADFLEVAYDGTAGAKKPPADYVIRQLRLNRPFLKRMREHQYLKVRLMALIESFQPKWETIVKQQPGTDNANTASEALEMIAMIRQLIFPS